MKKIVLIGAGGHCKVIIDIIRSRNEYEIVGITDKNNVGTVFNVPIIGNDDVLNELYDKGVKYAFICVGAFNNIKIRNVIYTRLKQIGYKLPVLLHKKAIVSQYASIEEGTCVMAGAIINPDAHISENCIINTGTIIEHECNINKNCNISPNCSIAGNVVVKNNTFIGIGSTVIEGINIGENVIIGAGTVVIRNVYDNCVMAGVPAKIIRKTC